ncbi:MAG: hypothetical protein LBT00_13900, partial [Spirochaetaceae bacterium]|nr:hypothetical protein [Spirochaetaceae bacterium]
MALRISADNTQPFVSIRRPPSLRAGRLVIANPKGEAIQKATRSVCPPPPSGLLHQRQLCCRRFAMTGTECAVFKTRHSPFSILHYPFAPKGR